MKTENYRKWECKGPEYTVESPTFHAAKSDTDRWSATTSETHIALSRVKGCIIKVQSMTDLFRLYVEAISVYLDKHTNI